MKKIGAILLSMVMMLSLIGCGNKETTKSKDGYEIALITDVGTIDDKSFNQASWEGVVKYAEENNLKYKYYKPTEKSDEAIMTAIDLAVKGNAKVIVCPGYLFEVPVYNAQIKYPDVTFIMVDASPHSGDYNIDIKENTYSIFYAEQEAGYLAGYAAVKDGYKKLGFMGGIALQSDIRYGYGFIQGANAAAQELGLAKDEVEIKYTYFGNFDASPENMSKAASWYNEGTEIIFACGGASGNSVMKAAETAGKKVIGVDVDQSGESETVITSAMKNLKKSVYDSLTNYYEGTLNGGTSVILTTADNDIMLPMETSKFTNFSNEDYNNLYEKLSSGEIKVGDDTTAEDATKVPADLIKVNLVK